MVDAVDVQSGCAFQHALDFDIKLKLKLVKKGPNKAVVNCLKSDSTYLSIIIFQNYFAIKLTPHII